MPLTREKRINRIKNKIRNSGICSLLSYKEMGEKYGVSYAQISKDISKIIREMMKGEFLVYDNKTIEGYAYAIKGKTGRERKAQDIIQVPSTANIGLIENLENNNGEKYELISSEEADELIMESARKLHIYGSKEIKEFERLYEKLQEINEKIDDLRIKDIKALLWNQRNYIKNIWEIIEVYKKVPECIRKKFNFNYENLENKLKILEGDLEALSKK